MNRRNIPGSGSVSALWRMKSMLILSMILLTGLAACGNAPSGTRSGNINVPLSVSPTDGKFTFTGNGSGNCTPGLTGTSNYQVNGGFPPYQIFSSLPELTGFLTRTLVNSGDILSITTTCPLTITGFSDLLIVDEMGSQVKAKFTLTLLPGTPLAITNTSPLAAGVVNQPYNVVMAATGGTAPLVWSIQSGVIPPGLTLNPTTGILSGTPTTAGQFSFVIAVVDANGLTTFKSFTIAVTGALTITTVSPLPAGAVNQFYSEILAASGGFPPYTWALTTGTLPLGLTLDPATGIISGTTTASGTFNFVVTATDSATPVANTVTKSLSLTIADTLTGLKITTTALPAATKGIAYSAALAATGGVLPYTWAITGGALPTGLTLTDPVNGIIAGTPNDIVGLYNLVVSVTDSAGSTAFGQVSLTLAGGGATAPGALAIATTSLPPSTAGVLYSAALSASGGTPPYTWTEQPPSVLATLGLNLSTAGIISGTPPPATPPGTFNLAISVSDSALPLASTVTANIPIIIQPAGTLTITATSPLPPGTATIPYAQTISVVGGTLPYTWAVTAGTLPPGLILNTATGVISGIPTTVGVNNFSISVTDATPTTIVKTFSLTIM